VESSGNDVEDLISRDSSLPTETIINTLTSHLAAHLSLFFSIKMSASKSIILTGASRGIGLAIAHYLLQESHKVFLVARSGEPLEKLKAQYPGQVEYVAADITDFSVRRLLILICCSFWQPDFAFLFRPIIGSCSEAIR
jgi:glutamyl-tRNA reductase